MSVYLRREYTNLAQNSNTISGAVSGSPWKYYQATYTTNATQEWIYLPDGTDVVGVSLSFAGGGTASIDVTDSPPDLVEAGTAVAITWPLGSLTVNTSTTLQGYTAFRVVKTAGTSVTVSVRV
jgi:hypothetical protein